MGPPWSKMGDMGTLATEGVGGKKIDLILDFRPRLPDITHNQKWYGKMGGFRGFVSLLWGSVEAPPPPPWSQMGNMRPLVTDGSGGKNWFDFRFWVEAS